MRMIGSRQRSHELQVCSSDKLTRIACMNELFDNSPQIGIDARLCESTTEVLQTIRKSQAVSSMIPQVIAEHVFVFISWRGYQPAGESSHKAQVDKQVPA